MEKVDGSNIAEFLTDNISSSSVLMTDEAHHYWPTGAKFSDHQQVDHRKGEDARERGTVTTNAAENFFSQLKRSIDGTHHQVSGQHLHRYVSEFDHRDNTAKIKDGERMARSISRARGKRLK